MSHGSIYTADWWICAKFSQQPVYSLELRSNQNHNQIFQADLLNNDCTV